jgi:geranylgeranylglycerol-phosphate geranylgeranyltransferase
MKTLKAIWELMRLEHGVMIAIAILIGAVITKQEIPPIHTFILTFTTALFLEASTFALNDYFDIEIDKHNKRMDRPLVRGDLSPQVALLIFFILFPLGIISAYLVNLTCFLIALITAAFAVIYDVWMKKIKLLGNFFIAYIMAIPFVFGGAMMVEINAFALTVSPAIIIIALIAFLSGVGREIMKDVMDYLGDKKKGVRSFPRYLGVKLSNNIAALFYITAVILSFLPFFQSIYSQYYFNYYYLAIVLITDTMLLRIAFQLFIKKTPDLPFHRKFSLVALFFGLIAFLVGAFTG